MRNEFNKHKKSDAVKWVATGLAAILLTAGVATTLTMGIKNNGWFEKKQEQTTDSESEPDVSAEAAGVYDENGNNLADGAVHDMPLSLTFIGNSRAASTMSDEITDGGSTTDNGIIENEDGTKSVTVQAKINRDIDVQFCWTLSWSGTPYGSDVTDYLQVVTDLNDSSIATLTMKKAFGTVAKLTVTVQGLSSVTTSCNLFYEVKGIDFVFSNTISEITSNTANTIAATEDGFSYSISCPVRTIGTVGSRMISDISATCAMSFVDTDRMKKDGYGFSGLLTTVNIKEFRKYNVQYTPSGSSYEIIDLTKGTEILNTDTIAKYYYGFNTYYLSFEPISVNLNSLKNCFYVDESSGLTQESFYLQGVDLLKTLGRYTSIQTTINISYKENGVAKEFGYICYSAVDFSALEGLSIDIGGGDVIF